MQQLFLLLNLFPNLDTAQLAAMNEDYETAAAIYKQIEEKNVPKARKGEYYFFSMVSLYKIRDYERASYYSNLILDTFEEIPDRYAKLAFMIKQDLANMKGELDSIARKMDEIGNRLDNGRAGRITQKKQKEIIDNLDEMIKQKEEQAKSGASAGNQENQPDQADKPGASANGNKPQQESQSGQETGKGKVDEQVLRNMQNNWAKMNDADRALAINKATRDLPPKYKVLIEDYFKALARDR
jgi:hypothetical protein